MVFKILLSENRFNLLFGVVLLISPSLILDPFRRSSGESRCLTVARNCP
jgi:hypothetical protein